MNTKLKALALAGTILAAPIFANAASAASIIGLIDGKSLVWIDPATKKVTGKVSRAQALWSASMCVRRTACCTR